MSAYVAAALLGLGTGAVYAALGLGLVLVHRASGVVNVAHGALAMYVTYAYAELRDVGDLVLPVAGLPPRIHLTDHPTFALAL
ncbi:MAG TPA: ABC transporter permease, partial [Frankiaceae bacterium]|nr:ABC transporter permease [Frankiaceae bacterium]